MLNSKHSSEMFITHFTYCHHGNTSIWARVRLNGAEWPVVQCLLADDTVLLAESERELQRVVGEFHRVGTRRKLRVNTGEK